MKKNIDVARAWRDEDYLLSLNEEERASLGVHPAGALSVTDEALRSITGGCCNTVSYCPGSAYCTPCPPKHCY
jgi:mersacidin/lichenicidin family type 2 lantibiotic